MKAMAAPSDFIGIGNMSTEEYCWSLSYRLPTALVLLCVVTDWKCNHSLLLEALLRVECFFPPMHFLTRS